MAVRIFACRHCGHMIRLGSDSCGQCDSPAPQLNRMAAHAAMVLIAAVLCAIGLVILSM